jgi:hypothetical protein
MKHSVVDSVTGYCDNCGSCQDCGQREDDGCMCYVPRHVRDEAAGGKVTVITAAKGRDWREMTWDEYCDLRPGKSDFDDVLCAECGRHVARCECPFEDNPGDQLVKIPAECGYCGEDLDSCMCMPAEDKAVPVPTSRKSPSIAPPWNREIGSGAGSARAASLSEDIVKAVAATRRLNTVTEVGWHEAAENMGGYIAAHTPAQTWAKLCLRCAARWPHPVTDTREVHQEAECPGCNRDQPGAIHVIPVHMAGDSDLCSRCLSETDRGDSRPALRALDENMPGLVSQEAADRYLDSP